MLAPALPTVPPAAPAGPVSGRWLIETQWLPDESGGLSHVTTLYAVVPKDPRARRYRLAAEGFRDPLYYGERIELEFDARRAVAGSVGWDDTRALDRGDCYWLSLSRAAGPAAQAEAARAWLQLRFTGLRVSVQPLDAAAEGRPMSPPGCPKGESFARQREGSPAIPPGRPNGESFARWRGGAR